MLDNRPETLKAVGAIPQPPPMNDTARLDSLLLRVDRLERQNRRLRRTMTAALGALLVVPLAAFAVRAPQQPGPVKASRFELVDQNGKVRGELGFSEKLQPQLLLKDGVEKEVAQLGVDDYGSPQFLLMDSKYIKRVKLAINKDTETLAILADKNGYSRISMAVDGGEHPHFLMHDKGQKPRIQMAVADSGAPSLVFIHVDGMMSAGLGIHENGRPWVRPEHPGEQPASQPAGSGR